MLRVPADISTAVAEEKEGRSYEGSKQLSTKLKLYTEGESTLRANIVSPRSLARPECSRPNIAESSVVSAAITDTPFIWDSYALRYQVYCEQRGFLPSKDYPSRFERDHFDEHAEHFGVYEGDFEEMIGTVRLVFDTAGSMPVERYCPYPIKIEDPAAGELKVAEISRLAVSKAGMARRARGMEVVLGLYLEIYHASKRNGVTHLLAAMEKSLVRLLGRLNLKFEPIGPEFDYSGAVRPYVLSIESIEKLVSPDLLRQIPKPHLAVPPLRPLQC